MGILEKISEIEKEIARTQKNKGEGWQAEFPAPVTGFLPVPRGAGIGVACRWPDRDISAHRRPEAQGRGPVPAAPLTAPPPRTAGPGVGVC